MNKEARFAGKTYLSASVEFEHEEDVYYMITRRIFEGEKSDINLLKTNEGEYNPTAIENPEDTINEILPKSMAPYFFFGGETTKKFLATGRKKDLKEEKYSWLYY